MNRDELQQLLNNTFGHLVDEQLLALTIYGEARGEGRDGMIGVGSAILERVEHRAWDGDTIKEVCLMPYQFSCFLPSDPNFVALKLIAQNFEAQRVRSRTLLLCYDIAAGLIAGAIPRTPAIAEQHICQYVETGYRQKIDKQAEIATGVALAKINEKRWWIRMKLAATINRHEFYA